MSEPIYNPDDPAFLLSRSLDEVLPADQQRCLEDALAGSELLRSEAKELRAVDRLVKRWGRMPVELDWDHHAALARAQVISDGDSEELGRIDRLLERWAGERVSFDEERFTAAVMARVEPARARSRRYGLIFRIGAPLAAAAAALVLVVTGGFWADWATTPEDVNHLVGQPVCRVVLGRGLVGAGPWSGEAAPLRSRFGGEAAPLRSRFGGEAAPLRSRFGGEAAPLRSRFGGEAAPLRSRFGSAPVASVAFVRSPSTPRVKGESVGVVDSSRGGPPISFGAVGAAPIGVGSNEGPTL